MTTPVVAAEKLLRQQIPSPAEAPVHSALTAHAEFAQGLPVQQRNRTRAAASGASDPVQAAPAFGSRRLEQSSPGDIATNDAGTNPTSETAPQAEQLLLAPGPLPNADTTSDILSYANTAIDTRASGSPMQMRLTGLMGALLLAGVIGSVCFRLVSAPRTATARVRQRRRVNWDSPDDDIQNKMTYARADAGPIGRARRPPSSNGVQTMRLRRPT